MAKEFDEAAYRERTVAEIRVALEITEWSAARLAKEIGVAPSTITRALDPNSKFNPSARTMDRLRSVIRAVQIEGMRRKVDIVADIAAEAAEITRRLQNEQAAIPVVADIELGRWTTVSTLQEPIGLLHISEPEYGQRGEFACRIVGNRTDRRLNDGSVVVIVPVSNAPLFENDIVLVRFTKDDKQNLRLMDLWKGNITFVLRDRHMGAPEPIFDEPTPAGFTGMKPEILGVVVSYYHLIQRRFGRPLHVPSEFLGER